MRVPVLLWACIRVHSICKKISRNIHISIKNEFKFISDAICNSLFVRETELNKKTTRYCIIISRNYGMLEFISFKLKSLCFLYITLFIFWIALNSSLKK